MLIIRKAKAADLSAILKLVNFYSSKGKLLRRNKREVKKNIGSFFVAVKNGVIVGCASLDIYSRKMAEIRSLAVKSSETHSGLGSELAKACIARAKKKKILEVMAITSEERFFKTIGFNFTLPGERKALFFNP